MSSSNRRYPSRTSATALAPPGGFAQPAGDYDPEWSDTVRLGIITEVTCQTRQFRRSGILGWIARGELASAMLPLLITGGAIVLIYFGLSALGPRPVGDALAWLFGWLQWLILLPVIVFVGFSMMAGGKPGGGGIDQVFRLMFRLFFKLLAALNPIGLISRNARRIGNDYVLARMREDNKEDYPIWTVTLERRRDTSAARGPAASGGLRARLREADGELFDPAPRPGGTGALQSCYVVMEGHLDAAPLAKGALARFHGEVRRNHVFFARWGEICVEKPDRMGGKTMEVQARIEASVRPNMRRRS